MSARQPSFIMEGVPELLRGDTPPEAEFGSEIRTIEHPDGSVEQRRVCLITQHDLRGLDPVANAHLFHDGGGLTTRVAVMQTADGQPAYVYVEVAPPTAVDKVLNLGAQVVGFVRQSLADRQAEAE